MGACVLPFPSVRRRRFILRHATRIAALKPEAGAKHLALQLRIQAETLARKGVSPESIDREQRALERAIKAELVHLAPSSRDAR